MNHALRVWHQIVQSADGDQRRPLVRRNPIQVLQECGHGGDAACRYGTDGLESDAFRQIRLHQVDQDAATGGGANPRFGGGGIASDQLGASCHQLAGPAGISYQGFYGKALSSGLLDDHFPDEACCS
ncbi:MAG: hypothetical protein QM757_17030 [Paludibaculum sp.]